MGDISIEDITKNLPNAAKAIEFESTGGGNRLIKKTKEHLEAEENCEEQMATKLRWPEES